MTESRESDALDEIQSMTQAVVDGVEEAAYYPDMVIEILRGVGRVVHIPEPEADPAPADDVEWSEVAF